MTTWAGSRIDVAVSVQEALECGRPVVALETAVATHGLPPPLNLEALQGMERAVRERGVVPATCVVLDGTVIVGATLQQVEQVCASPQLEKSSVRDLGRVVALGGSAGLTVSATLHIAHAAGITVFATGGIGGVHLDSHQSGDVSTDLLQLARTPMITICSGAKSVLDIGRTLEYLESVGVPVTAYGSTQFPAFYLTDSGHSVPALYSPEDIAAVAAAGRQLGSEAGLVVGNPVPSDFAIAPEQWQGWLDGAQTQARLQGITGKAVTPFLLEHVAGASQGATVRTNIALLYSNASLAADVARACAL